MRCLDSVKLVQEVRKKKRIMGRKKRTMNGRM